MLQRVCVRAALVAASAALAACSALQIDVDVYKGSLSHEPDIQVQQYAALAMAAKPVLATLRNDMYRAAIGVGDGTPNLQAVNDNLPVACRDAFRRATADADKVPPPRNFTVEASSFAATLRLPKGAQIPAQERNRYSYWMQFEGEVLRGAYFINGLLSYYEPDVCVHRNDDWHRARPDKGLIELFNAVRNAAIALEHGKRDAKATAESRATLRANLDSATEDLTAELIPFAERILFVVNNPSLFSDDKNRIERAILQTLGNSLILHANDLRRRQAHETNQQMRFDAQRRAAEPVTAAQGPAVLLDSVARQLAASKASAVASAAAASAALATSQQLQAQALKRAEETKTALEAADKALAAWKHPQPAVQRAHATLVDPASAASTADAPAAAQDRAALLARAAAFKPGETVTARALADDLLAWLDSQRDAKLAPGQRQQRLAGMARALHRTEPLVDLQPVAAGPAPQVLVGIAAAVDQAQALHLAGRDALAKTLAKAQADDAAARLRSTQAAADVATKKADKDAKDTVAAQATDAQKATTEALRTAIEATTGTPAMHPEAVRQVLLSKLDALDATKASPGEKTAARAALAAVQLAPAYSFRAGNFDEANGTHGTRKTAMQVLEDLVAYLRTRRTAVLAEKGDGEEAKNLALAIESAEQQRTDQVFLRPSADYLRNVYASTALQDESRAPDRNMLLDYLRNLKLGGERDKSNGVDDPGRDINKARADLEKLFWQNINRVTTNGGTLANHVIAKDDVGNWYIKTFSTDPKQVFESAKSLLLFNQGGRIDTNLLRRAELRDQARNGTQAEKDAANAELAKAGSSPAGLAVGARAQQRFRDRYADETKTQALALRERVLGLPEKELGTAWAVDLATGTPEQVALLPGLKASAAKLQQGRLSLSIEKLDSELARLGTPAATPDGLGKAVVDLLDKALNHREALAEMLAQQQAPLAGDTNTALRKRLVASARKVLNGLIDDSVQARQRSIDTYQEGLASIADTVR